jgi:hypothetical protein
LVEKRLPTKLTSTSGTDGDGTLRVSNQGGDPVTEQQLARMAKRRLAILRHAEEITGNVALTCR